MQINTHAFNSVNNVGTTTARSTHDLPEIKLPFKSEQDTVTLSPQAQIIQKTGEHNQARLDSGEAEDNKSSEEKTDNFVRVSSSIGQAASKFGLSEQEAIDLYKKIDEMV